MAKVHLTSLLNLGLSQHEVDFVDINFNGDTPLYLDPYFIGQRTDAWSVAASKTVRDFFKRFIDLIRSNREQEAFELFSHLKEPNETRLGQSKGKPQGRGVGKDDALNIFNSLKLSKAVQTGLVEDLEDCRLFVDGIDKDKTSDMMTNIIRKHLHDYTKTQCKNHGIPMQEAATGFMWITPLHQWVNTFDDCLVVNGQKLLLVPKAIVSYSNVCTSQQYHQHFVLNFLQNEHLRLGTSLVEKRKLKNGETKFFLTKKKLKETVAPLSKEFLTQFTSDHPSVFDTFKTETRKLNRTLSNDEISGDQTGDVVQHLLKFLASTLPGDEHASQFHKVVAAILELLFYPHLITPEIEVKIHDGRKRIDVVYDNAASEDFFWKLHQQYQTPCQFIFVECKNYSTDPKNNELDQLSGRFSPNKGKFGILVCRKIEKMDLFLKRCADTYKDQRGIIIPLTDEDLIEALNLLINGNPSKLLSTLQDRFRKIALD